MKNLKSPVITLLLLILLSAPVVGSAGTLQFYANGEDLATEGFIAPKRTKDGWVLMFRHIYVGLTDIAAYQTSPPYDAASGGQISATAATGLTQRYPIDLVAQAAGDSRVLVGEADAAAGHYNAVSWRVVLNAGEPLDGYAMVFIGTAQKDGTSVDFELVSTEEATYRCGEYVGDERKGFVTKGGVANLEMTFHLDHIFGRADKPAEDPMNLEAVGFEPFAAGGRQPILLKGKHIGHAGEGHCAVEWH